MESLGPLEDSFSQKTLRQRKRRHPGHRSFAVLRHPVLRVHLAYAVLIGWPVFAETREVLAKTYRLPFPKKPTDTAAYAEVLLAFATWLKANLNNQTSLPVHTLWASQSATLAAFGQIATPDLLAREESLSADLAYLAAAAGIEAPPFVAPANDPAPVKLADIWSQELEETVQAAYLRDYMQFGFGPWQG